LHYDIFLEGIKYDDINKTREGLVLELYNQGKTYREISKETRISPRDIGVILNRVIEEKTEGLKEEQQLTHCYSNVLTIVEVVVDKEINR
jgi:DNA invertase Pin-like site-specific DNA recombinase